MQFVRSTADSKPGMFLVKGDVLEIWPSSSEEIIRLDFFGDELENITRIEHLTNERLENLEEILIFPAKHFVTEKGIIDEVLPKIKAEMESQVEFFQKNGKLVEAERIKMRTEYDMEMMAEVGYVNGIENYSMYLGGRNPGDAPATLIEFFRQSNKDGGFLTFIDESHITISQIGGMYA